MERDAHVRAARRRQVVDALEFERQREAMLVEQLQDVVAEVDGTALDAVLFARMNDEEAELVRAALGDVLAFDFGEDEEDAAPEEPEPGDGVEEEAARLQGEIDSSRRIQAALSRYLALLDERSAGRE